MLNFLVVLIIKIKQQSLLFSEGDKEERGGVLGFFYFIFLIKILAKHSLPSLIGAYRLYSTIL